METSFVFFANVHLVLLSRGVRDYGSLFLPILCSTIARCGKTASYQILSWHVWPEEVGGFEKCSINKQMLLKFLPRERHTSIYIESAET